MSSAGNRAQCDPVPHGDKQLVALQGWLSPCLPSPLPAGGVRSCGLELLEDSGFISVPGDPSWVLGQRWLVSLCRSGGCDVFNTRLQVSITKVFSRSSGQN